MRQIFFIATRRPDTPMNAPLPIAGTQLERTKPVARPRFVMGYGQTVDLRQPDQARALAYVLSVKKQQARRK